MNVCLVLLLLVQGVNMAAERVIDSLASRILELERFIDISNDATNDLLEQQRNENTKKVTASHMRLFKSYLEQKNENQSPEMIPPDKLDKYIAQFLMSVRKKGDTSMSDCERQYEPQTLLSMHSSINRYLVSKNYAVNIKQAEVFRHSRDVLNAKMKELKTFGKGNLPNASQPFTDTEFDILAQKELLGTSKTLSML